MSSIPTKILITGVLAALLPLAIAQSGSADNDVRKAEEAWAAAVKASDASALEKLLANDLVYTHSTGNVDSKTDYLSKMKAGTQKYTDLQYSGMKVRTFNGSTGVVNSQLRMIGATNGTPFDNTVYVIHVWVKQGGSWKLVAHQTTRKG
jgi:ketosteroid isomerase-like protein